MESRILFMLGSNGTFKKAIKDYLNTINHQEKKIILLLPGTKVDIQLKKDYLKVLNTYCIKKISIISPLNKNYKNISFLKGIFSSHNGLILGGGNSFYYYKNYYRKPFLNLIKIFYNNGNPVMGCCGGALILSDIYTLYQEKNGPIECKSSFSLIENTIIGIHFLEKNNTKYIFSDMLKTKSKYGLGIDKNSYVMLSNEKVLKSKGNVFYIDNISLKDKKYV